MIDVPSSAYPQKIDEVGAAVVSAANLPSPLGHIHGENALYMRARKVIDYSTNGQTICLRVATCGSLNHTIHTHETAVHLLKDTDSAGEMHVEISFWSPAIFRVRFAENSLPPGEPLFPPAEARMLVGRPDVVALEKGVISQYDGMAYDPIPFDTAVPYAVQQHRSTVVGDRVRPVQTGDGCVGFDSAQQRSRRAR